MEARELRIGNLVSCSKIGDAYTDRTPYHGKFIFEVGGITEDIIHLRIGHGATQRVQSKYCEPIPLAEDWLKRAGFSQVFSTDPQEPNAESRYFNDQLSFYTSRGDCMFYFNDFPIKIAYVHQLQNLYFALTGEELIFSE